MYERLFDVENNGSYTQGLSDREKWLKT